MAEQDGTNRQIVADVYDAWGRGDADASTALFHPEMEWRPAEGHPYSPEGTPWVGLADLTENFFSRVGRDWERFTTRPIRLHEAGDVVVVEGRYSGVFTPNGRDYDAQFCHVWTLNDGRIISLSQYADTAEMQRVMGRDAR